MEISPLSAHYINEGATLVIHSDYELLYIKIEDENESLCESLFKLINMYKRKKLNSVTEK